MSKPRLALSWGRWPRAVALVLGLGLLALSLWAVGAYLAGERDRSARAAIEAGREFLKRGRPHLALRAVSGLAEDGPRGAEVLAVRGLAWALLDRPEDARRPLERSWELDPKQPMVAKVLAAVYFSRSQTNRGVELLQAAARLDPGDFRPWFGAGDMFRKINKPEGAARAFEQALRRKPDHHESRVGLIWAKLATRPPEEATPLLEQALRERPDDPEALGLAARQALALGRNDEAMRLAGRCLALDPNRVDALLVRARLNRASGHLDDALADAERAVAQDPRDLAGLHLLSLVESALGLKGRAAETSARHRALTDQLTRMNQYQELIEAHPDDPEPRWQLGQVAAEAGMRDFAERSFRAALSLDPDCRPAREGLAALGAPEDR